jgi:hypothetical protein
MADKRTDCLFGRVIFLPVRSRGEHVNLGVYLADRALGTHVYLAPIDYTFARASYVFGPDASGFVEADFKRRVQAFMCRLLECRPSGAALRRFIVDCPGPFTATDPSPLALKGSTSRGRMRQAEELALEVCGNAYQGSAAGLIASGLRRASGNDTAAALRMEAGGRVEAAHRRALEAAADLAQSRVFSHPRKAKP